MMKVNRTAASAIMLALMSATVIASPAEAHGRHGRHSNHYHDDYRYAPDYGHYESRRHDRDYRRHDYRRSNYRGCDNGTGGTVIGAVAGGLIGNEIARRGSKTEGTIIGAAIGALGGRAIDKADDPCRRR